MGMSFGMLSGSGFYPLLVFPEPVGKDKIKKHQAPLQGK